MESNRPFPREKGPRDYLRVLKRRIHWFVWPMLLVFCAGIAFSLFLPNIYRSEAIILIEGQRVTDALVPTTVTSYADQRIQAIAQEVMSRSKILELVRKFNLYPKERKRITTDALVEKVKRSISIKPISAEIKSTRSNTPSFLTIAFSLAFEGQDPKKVQQVTNELASFFLSKNIEARKESAKGTAEFLKKQVERAKADLARIQEKIARFKEQHLEELPEFMNLNLQNVERVNTELNNISREMLSLQEQLVTINNQLASMSPYTSEAPSSRVLSDEEKLQQLELKRAQLKARYSEKYPELRSIEREIRLLKARTRAQADLSKKRERLAELQQELANLRARYSDKHPSVRKVRKEIKALQEELAKGGHSRAPKELKAGDRGKNATNPAYVTLRAERDRIRIRIKSLAKERKRLLKERDRIYAQLKAMPEVEKVYNEYLGDYEEIKTRLTQLQQKLDVAQIAEGMEEGQLGERFTMIEPPFLPEEPYKPNRMAILIISAILGLGLGVASASLKEFSDRSIRYPEEIEMLSGSTVLTIIPKIRSPRDIRRRRIKILTILLLVVGIPAGALIAFHFLVMDLYVFYHKALRFLSERLFILK